MSIAEKLTTVAENQQKVYDAGIAAGRAEGDGGSYDEGYGEGFDAGYAVGHRNGYTEGEINGKQSEYDRLWDSLQQNGERTDYSGAFGVVWDNDNFKPKYDIKPVNASTMFENSSITDLKAVLESAGVVLDFSGVARGNFVQFLQQSQITRIGVVDTTGNKEHMTNYLFMGARKLREIEKWVMTDDGTQLFGETNTFQSCPALEEIRLEGRLGCSMNFSPCTKLSYDSIESIFRHLREFDMGWQGATLTLSKTAVDNAYGYYDESGTFIPGSESEAFTELAITAFHWTVSVV